MTLLSAKQINALLKVFPIDLRVESKFFLVKSSAYLGTQNNYDVLFNEQDILLNTDDSEELIKIHYYFAEKIAHFLHTAVLKQIVPLVDIAGIYHITFLFRRSFLDHAMENKNDGVAEYVITAAVAKKVMITTFFPLYRAALHGNLVAMRLLINAGADYTQRDSSNRDILTILAHQGHFELIAATERIIEDYKNQQLSKPTSGLRHRHPTHSDFYNADEYGLESRSLKFFTQKTTVSLNRKNEIISNQTNELLHLGL